MNVESNAFQDEQDKIARKFFIVEKWMQCVWVCALCTVQPAHYAQDQVQFKTLKQIDLVVEMKTKDERCTR